MRMIARFLNSPHNKELHSETPPVEENKSEETPANSVYGKQPVPVWSTYNSVAHIPLHSNATAVVDHAFSLPLINAPAHE